MQWPSTLSELIGGGANFLLCNALFLVPIPYSKIRPGTDSGRRIFWIQHIAGSQSTSSATVRSVSQVSHSLHYAWNCELWKTPWINWTPKPIAPAREFHLILCAPAPVVRYVVFTDRGLYALYTPSVAPDRHSQTRSFTFRIPPLHK